MRLYHEPLVWLEIGEKIGHNQRARVKSAVCIHLLGKTSKTYKNKKITFLEEQIWWRLLRNKISSWAPGLWILLLSCLNICIHVITNALIHISTDFVKILWNILSRNNLLFRSFMRRSQSLWSSSLFVILEQSWSRMS